MKQEHENANQKLNQIHHTNITRKADKRILLLTESNME